MKILGKNSLSSKIEIGLIILLIIGIVIALTVGTYVLIYWEKWMNLLLTKVIAIAYLSSFPALTMLIQFIKIFQNLKDEKAFEKENIKSFKISYIASFIISIIYILNTSLLLINTTQIDAFIVYPLLMGIVAMVFFIFGIGLIVLTEIYKKAIQFKEENELTI